MIIETNAYDINGDIVNTVTQWDKDIYLYITDYSITSSSGVDFFNPNGKIAYKMEAEVSGHTVKTKIPNILLQTTYPIIGCINVESDDSVRVMYRFIINVSKRPLPTDYIYVDTEDYDSVHALLDDMRDALSEIRAAKTVTEQSLAEVKRKAEETMQALESASVQFNISSADDGAGNVAIIATVID